MSKQCFIGIDQGSSSTKTIAISEEGQLLFQTKRPLPAPIRTENTVEYDPLSILKSVEEGIQETIQSIKASGFEATAAGLSCQRSSCLMWNRQTGEPLSPVISWRDLRGSGFITGIADKSDSVFEASGLPLTPYYSASKLKWLSENVSSVSRDSAVFGTLSSFLITRLTGSNRPVIDHTQAARTQLMNIQTLAWDPDLLERFRLTGASLPEIVPVLSDFGAIGTPAGPLPLVASIGDQQAAMIGLGVVEPGDGGINYGTGGFLIVNTGESLIRRKGLMSSIHYSDAEKRFFLIEGSVNAVGDAMEWLRSSLRLFSDYDELDDVCWQAANDVVGFIGLNGTGAPHWEHDISSAIHGLTPGSTASDIVRAVVEGIAFFIRDIEAEIRAAGFEPHSFAVSGGLSSLSYLTQIQADVLGKEVIVSAQREVSALGAALLAGMARGVWSVQDVKRMARAGEVVPPRTNAGAEKRYRRWKELHRMTANLDKL